MMYQTEQSGYEMNNELPSQLDIVIFSVTAAPMNIGFPVQLLRLLTSTSMVHHFGSRLKYLSNH